MHLLYMAMPTASAAVQRLAVQRHLRGVHMSEVLQRHNTSIMHLKLWNTNVEEMLLLKKKYCAMEIYALGSS